MIPFRTLLRTMQTASLASPPSKAATDALARVSPAQLTAMLDDPEVLVVDVRRADMDDEGMQVMIRRAINLPAQTFPTTLPTLYPFLRQHRQVVFHCVSSNGRGPRCAGWYASLLASNGHATESEAVVLAGGIKAFLSSSRPSDIVRLS